MVELDYRPELDTGISYAASTNSVRALLDKLRKNKPKPGEAGLPPLMAYRGIPAVVGPPHITGLSALLDDLIELADPRPRNNLGMFQPQGEGGPDPNAMWKTYGPQQQPPPQQQSSNVERGILGATLAAPAAGAGATAGGLAVKELYRKLKKGKIKK